MMVTALESTDKEMIILKLAMGREQYKYIYIFINLRLEQADWLIPSIHAGLSLRYTRIVSKGHIYNNFNGNNYE